MEQWQKSNVAQPEPDPEAWSGGYVIKLPPRAEAVITNYGSALAPDPAKDTYYFIKAKKFWRQKSW
jgi:hypothetical protein